MAAPQLSIHPALVQHYLLEVDVDEFQRVRDTILEGGAEQMSEQAKVGAWKMFVWLDRPNIWAIRPVGVTSGLDTFLLSEGGLTGLRDVSELISCVIGGAGTEPDAIAGSWEEFGAGFTAPGVLFCTFLWPNLDALAQQEAWGGEAVPPRSQVLATIRRCLGAGVARARENRRFAGDVKLLLCTSAGDCDLVLYGFVQASKDLDLCLYLLTQMGSDVLTAEAFGQERAREARNWPVFRSSRTELALDLDLYLRVLEAARGQWQLGKTESRTLDQSFCGRLFPEVGLTRGRGPIPRLENGLQEIAGHGWQDRAVFGREDFILESTGERTFGDTVKLLARLDAAACKNSAFPRRSSIRLGIGSLAHDSDSPTRRELFGETLSDAVDTPPPAADSTDDEAFTIQSMKRLIEQLRTVGWREDLRIIERMAERCMTLRRSPDLRRETKLIIQAALKRLAVMCRRLEDMETAEPELPAKDGGEEAPANARAIIARDIRLLRSELLQSGMSLDRVLSHHSKGAVSLLLHPGSQARGPDHIGSEIGLSLGLGVLFRGPAQRLQEQLDAGGPLAGDPGEWLRELKDKLSEIAMPIIYASHEPDFSIRPELTLLHVPRWALWYPAAASHLIHELGHSLAIMGPLAHLMAKVLQRLHMLDSQHDRSSSACLHLEHALRELGLPASRAELDERPAALGKFASRFFRPDSPSDDNFGADPEQLRDLEEIVCDVVARLFSYSDASPGDQRQLWDCFDYVAPFTARTHPEANYSLLLRLLAAHIAVRHLRAIRESRLQPLSEKGRRQLWEVTKHTTESFHRQLADWAADFAGRQEHRKLPAACYDAIVALPNSFRGILETLDWKRELRGFQLAAHFIAVILSIPPLRHSVRQSLFKATHVWGSLVPAAWAHGSEEAWDAAIIETLHQGQVPALGCQFPERLPRAVAWNFRGFIRREVPAHVRAALSFYLSDLSRF